MARPTFTEITKGNATSSSSPNTAAFSGAAGDAFLVWVDAQFGAAAPNEPTLTQSGATYIKIATKTQGSSGQRARCSLYLCLTASGFSSAALNLDFAGQVQTEVAWIIQRIANHYAGGVNTDITGRQAAVTGGADTGNALTLTLGALHHADNVPIGLVYFRNNDAGTAPTGWSNVSTQVPQNTYRVRVDSVASTDPSADFTWGGTSVRNAGILVEIRAATDTDATTCSVTTQPAGAVNGSAFTTQPVVQLRDALGNAVAQSGVTIVPTKASGSGTLGGSETAGVATNASGIATFTNLKITGTGNHALTFTPTSLTPANSATFFVSSAGPATKWSFTVQPVNTPSGVPITPAVAVQMLDSSNVPYYGSGTNVTIVIASGTGTLAGMSTPATDATGTATFTGMNISLTGADLFTLTATGGGLTAATSSSFIVYAGSGGVHCLVGDGGLAY